MNPGPSPSQTPFPRLDRIQVDPELIVGDAEELVEFDWSGEWDLAGH